MPHADRRLASSTAPDRYLAPADRPRIDSELADALAAAERRYATNPHLAPLYARAAEFVLRGGKRVRPRLCLASHRILSGQPGAELPRPVVLAAVSLELFHAFMLVHDDLIDGSTLRRDRPTLHEAIRLDAADPADAKTPADLALIAGDLLFALGMRLLARAGLGEAAMARANRFLADMLFETGVGEALDVLYGGCPLDQLNEPQILEAYLRKTSRYSISGPLILGAILAGAPPATCRVLGRFGDLIGLGYQIRNDLDGLADDPAAGCPDLDTGKRTLVLWTAYRRLDPPGRAALTAVLAAPVGPDRRRRLMDLIRSGGAIDASRDRLAGLRRQATAALRGSPLTTEQRRAFAGLLAWIDSGTPARPPVASASRSEG